MAKGDASGATNGMRPVHPGEILKHDCLNPLRLSVDTLARALRIPADHLAQIIAGKRAISSDVARRLGDYFGMSAEFWLDVQDEYDLRINTE